MKALNKLVMLVVVIPILIQGCTGGGTQEQPNEEPPTEYTIEQFMNTIQIFGSSFSPDESKILFTSKETGIYNAYEIPVTGGDARQLTTSDDDYVVAISYFPEDERFLFTSDQGGNEINHIYVMDTDGETQDLIDDPEAKAQFYGWAGDKQSFFYTTNKRDPRYFDLYEMDISSSEPGSESNVFSSQLVYENEGYSLGPVSDDEKWMALIKPLTTNNNDLYVRNMESGENTHISEHEGIASFSPQYFSFDNKKLFYTTNKDGEFRYLMSYDIETGEHKKIEEAEWDIVYAGRSENNKYRYVGINADAKTEIKIYLSEDGSQVDLPVLPEGEITSINISDSEELMAFYVNSSTSPNNLYVYDFGTGEYIQLTNTLNPEIDQNDLVAGEVIRFKSFDGLEIPAILYKPKGIQPGELRPAVLDIHGGPGGQRRLNYQYRVQYLVNHGYVVLSVNNRGSSGYGKTFNAADDQKHGDVDLKDCIWSKNYLKETGYVDPEKIGIMGGSYGGYMVMAALTFAPEEFAVGVNYFGVTNWLRTLKSIPPWWESFKEALYNEMGDPNKDSVALYNKSPLFHAENITKPVIVLQGANDPRVLKVESDEIVEAAKNNNVPVEYVIFDNEGHGFVKKENQIEASKKVLQFLDKYLWQKEPENI